MSRSLFLFWRRSRSQPSLLASSPAMSAAAAASSSSEPSKGTVLVTGATGFIAGHVILQLLHAGYTVRGSVRALPQPQQSQTPGSPAPLHVDRTISASAALADMVQTFEGRLQLVVADLTKPGSFDAAVDGCDAVLHVASPVNINPRDPDDVIRPAIEGTRNVLNAALREARRRGATSEAPYRVIVTSSDAAIVSSGHRPAGKVYSEADWNTTAVPHHQYVSLARTHARSRLALTIRPHAPRPAQPVRLQQDASRARGVGVRAAAPRAAPGDHQPHRGHGPAVERRHPGLELGTSPARPAAPVRPCS